MPVGGCMKKSLVVLVSACIFKAILCQGNAFALDADIYQSMACGTAGELLTSDTMNASSRGGAAATAASWAFYRGDKMWVSDEYARKFPGTISIGGQEYTMPGTHTWRFRNREQDQYVRVVFGSGSLFMPHHDRMTIACFFTTDQTATVSNYHDNIEIGCYPAGYAVLQTVNKLYLRAHSETDGKSTVSPSIKIEPSKTYWINLHHDGVAGVAKVGVWNADTWEELPGSPVVASSNKGTKARSFAHFGNCSPHGDYPDNETCAFFQNIIIDFTNGAFPLLPDSTGETSIVKAHGEILPPLPYATSSMESFAVNGARIAGRGVCCGIRIRCQDGKEGNGPAVVKEIRPGKERGTP
jgi:hypothetical protein